jgi:drug/metabolite transporter (DMT)-like permease
MTRRGWIYFAAVGAIWGLPYLLIKISVREISPPLLVLIRTGGAAVILLPIAAATGALVPVIKRWRAVLVYTCAELALPWVLLTNAERQLPSSLSGLLVAAVPLVAAVLAWTTGSDRVDMRRLVGLLLGLGGVGALVGFAVAASQLLAALSIGGVVVGYAVGPWVVDRRLRDVPPMGVVTWSFVFCAVGYAPFAALSLPHKPLSASVVESVVGLTVVCTVIGFLVYFALIREVGAMRATLITYVNPAVAVVLGVFALGEPFGPATGIGFVLILGGCFLATRPLDRGRGQGARVAGAAFGMPATLDPESPEPPAGAVPTP